MLPLLTALGVDGHDVRVAHQKRRLEGRFGPAPGIEQAVLAHRLALQGLVNAGIGTLQERVKRGKGLGVRGRASDEMVRIWTASLRRLAASSTGTCKGVIAATSTWREENVQVR